MLPRRPFTLWLHHAPQTLRAMVRTDELWLVVVAGAVGILSGLAVVATNDLSMFMHRRLFDLHTDGRLSGLASIEPLRALLVPTVGGLALGLTGLIIVRFRPRRPVDPIEANALYGGQLSVTDSLVVLGQTIVSNGVGASVGLEAGYTQICSAFGSRLGRALRVRRADLRLLVGCGAAGAIASAFDAPLTGAFYAFELVIGTYTLASLAPVAGASVVAVLVTRLLGGNVAPGLDLALPDHIAAVDYLPILALGMIAALVGIMVMRTVTLTESVFRRSRVPVWLRPAIGGLAVGGLALVTPSVLSSGHAAMRIGLAGTWTLPHLVLLLLLKSLASAISIGSGFRGGLFFASLFLGVLTGSIFGDLLALTGDVSLPPVVCALVGMSALAVAVIGGPLTMAFLTLETTSSLPLTIAVIVAAVVSSVTVRRAFGYSFATWRFHLRGEAIRSAVDIGWVRNLSVGRMMRREVRVVRTDTALATIKRDFPLGSTPRIVAIDERGHYAGIANIPEIHAVESDGTLADALYHRDHFLLPQQNIKEAISTFEQGEADALAVLDNNDDQHVIGVLTEQHALKRYAEELERARRAVSGE
jgi:CIC family chloride channel protein